VDAYDAPNVESDLATYRGTYGLPTCTSANGCFTKVNQNGATAPLPAANSDWVGETTLDVEMVSAVCPTCHILLVEAADDDRSGQPNLETAVATAARLGAKYVSMSWGSGEYGGESSQDATYFSAPNVSMSSPSSSDSGIVAARSGSALSRPMGCPSRHSCGATSPIKPRRHALAGEFPRAPGRHGERRDDLPR